MGTTAGSSMSDIELRKELIIRFKEHHHLLPTTSYLDDLIRLMARSNQLAVLEARIDEYLTAEEAWINYKQDEYFDNRHERLDQELQQTRDALKKELR